MVFFLFAILVTSICVDLRDRRAVFHFSCFGVLKAGRAWRRKAHNKKRKGGRASGHLVLSVGTPDYACAGAKPLRKLLRDPPCFSYDLLVVSCERFQEPRLELAL